MKLVSSPTKWTTIFISQTAEKITWSHTCWCLGHEGWTQVFSVYVFIICFYCASVNDFFCSECQNCVVYFSSITLSIFMSQKSYIWHKRLYHLTSLTEKNLSCQVALRVVQGAYLTKDVIQTHEYTRKPSVWGECGRRGKLKGETHTKAQRMEAPPTTSDFMHTEELPVIDLVQQMFHKKYFVAGEEFQNVFVKWGWMGFSIASFLNDLKRLCAVSLCI